MKTLPLGTPLITVYPHHAFYQAILQNNPNSLQWIYSNFVLLTCSKNYVERGSLHFEYLFFHEYEGCPYLDINKLPRSIAYKSMDIVNFAKESINQNYYMFLFIDEYDLPDRNYTGRSHVNHDNMLFGYDDLHREFDIVYYNVDGKYTLGKISYKQLEDAFRSSAESHYIVTDRGTDNPIRLIRCINGNPYSFNKKLFSEMIRDFAYSQNPTERFSINALPDDSNMRAFGIDVLKVVCSYIQDVVRDAVSFDRRVFFILKEHMQLMINRFKYLKELEIFSGEFSISAAENILTLLDNGLSLSIKYMITDNSQALLNARDLYLNAYEKERVLFQSIVKNIDQ